jgi:phage tail-like protein
MARTSVEDPLKSFRFLVFSEGFARAGFSECSGLERTTEEVKYREGGDNETSRKSPGLTEFGDITLKRGQVLDQGQNDFYNWAQEVHDVASLGGSTRDFRREIDIVQFERGGMEVARWRCYECWPKRFKPFSNLEGGGNNDSIEELVLACEGFEKTV